MKKFLQIVLIALVVAACGTPLEQPWRNFNAYFNTYYNANQYYNKGLDQNQRQLPEVNPELPIKVFPSPTQAGLQEFEKAIETGATILRNHSESKYVEPAIYIIGKSFFYRAEYFSALEKFQELQMLSTGELEQKAIFWQGRVYHEMQNYQEGIRFLEEEIELVDNWDEEILAKTRTILAQHYVSLGEWGTASRIMEESITSLPERDMRDRAYFVYGQVLERMGDFEEARMAFGNIRSSHQDYSLVYNAQRREAELARRTGDYDLAYDLFYSMERSDKFYDVRVDLQYEVARTVQLMGRSDDAMRLYNRVLHNRFQSPGPETKAKTYYGIAEIYRFDRDDFIMAAAYYDSSAQERANRERMPQWYDAREMAASFGEYAQLSGEIAEMDSLLYLGSLEPAAFDSVIAVIQQQKQAEIEQQLEERQRQQSQVVTVDSIPDETAADVAEETEYGFLNVRNQMRVTDASLQFQAVWGDRPLADNWRRRADVRGSRFDQLVEEEGGEENVIITDEGTVLPASQAAMDLSDIPFTDEDRNVMLQRKDRRYYQLGNVFFLSLNMPDSAKVYYKKVADQNLSPDIIPRALYSLTEIELLQENIDDARAWGRRLIDEYPRSVFARRIAERLDIELEQEFSDEEILIENLYWQYRNDVEDDPVQKAEKYKHLVKNGARDDQKPLLLYEAALAYMQAANSELQAEGITIDGWFRQQSEWEKKKSEFSALQDSALVMLADTTLSESDMEYWQDISDSTLTEPDFKSLFPFEGAYWDSTRSILGDIETMYASSSVMPKVRILNSTLEPPVEETEDEELDEPEEIIDEVVPELEADEELPRCTDLDPVPQIAQGMDQFMDSIVYPDWTRNADMMGEVLFRLSISEDGEVTDFEQASRLDRSGLPEAFETAINEHLSFDPESLDGATQCVISFWFEF